MKNKDQILLEKAYQNILENYNIIRSGQPLPDLPLDPPDDSGPECPECGGPMYDAQRAEGNGRSDKWSWEFKCIDKNCDGIISGDNLP